MATAAATPATAPAAKAERILRPFAAPTGRTFSTVTHRFYACLQEVMNSTGCLVDAVATRTVPGFGRSVFAEEALPAAHVVLDGESPLVHAITDASSSSACHHTLEPLEPESPNAIRCDGKFGGIGVFASTEAFDAFVDNYGQLLLGTADGVGEELEDSAPLRLLLLIAGLRSEDAGDAGRTRQQRFDRIRALCSNREHFSEETLLANRRVAEVASRMLQSTSSPMCTDEALELLLIIRCNAHSMGDIDTNIQAVGLFGLGSAFNHSCDPNCTFFTRDRRLYVRTVRPVAAAEQLTISYTELYRTRLARRIKLRAQYAFLCRCTRCNAQSEKDGHIDGFLCSDAAASPSACGGTMAYFERECAIGRDADPRGEWLACDRCGRVPLPEEADRRVRIADSLETEGAFASASSGGVDPIVSVVAQLERLVHPGNHRLMRVRLQAVRGLRKSGARAAELSLLLIAVLNALEHAPYSGACTMPRGNKPPSGMSASGARAPA